jgi:hypothetical protein
VIWIIFLMNVLTVVIAFKKRMLLYALLAASFLFLITGQAIQIQADLSTQRTVNYLFNFISDVGFDLALRYVFGVSAVMLALAFVSQGYRKPTKPMPIYSFAPGRGFYVALFLYLCLVSFILIFLVVGLSEFLYSTRPGFQPGSTIFLVLLSLGLLPLLFKIMYKGRIGAGDITCFLVAFVITGIMGRLSAGFYLLMIALVLYYERGWAEAPLTPRLIAKLLSFALASVVLFVAYGAIRGAQAFVSGNSLGDIVAYIEEHPEKSVLSLEWNYRFDIEGMSGIAGAFTQSLSDPNSVHHDFGASWLLTGAIQSIPGFLKPYASSITDLSNDLDWYPYSIVPTGVESFFMSFGWSAILIYPLAQYLVAWRFPLWFLNLRLSPAAKTAGYIVMGWSVIFMRGPLITWVAFCITYPLIFLLSWPFFSRHFKRRDLSIEMKSRIGGNKLLTVETAKGH